MGETPALDSTCGQVLCFNGGNLHNGLRCGQARKSEAAQFEGSPRYATASRSVAGVRCGLALSPVELHATKAFVEQEVLSRKTALHR